MVLSPEAVKTLPESGSSGPPKAAAFLAALFLTVLAAAAPSDLMGASCISADPLFDIGRGGSVPLRQPSDLSVHDETLFVLDDLNGRVVRYNLGGEFLSEIPLPGGSGTPYLGFDVGGDDNIYLASSGSGKIIVLSQTGKVVREFETGEKGSASEPVAVDVYRGNCSVVDKGEHMVKVFDLEGNVLNQWGGLGEDREKFRYPFRIARDSTGRIIVSDSLNSRVKTFTPKGEPLVDFGEFGVSEGTLFRPAGVGVWQDDQLLVSDNYLGSVQVFNLKGEYRAVLCGSDGTPLLFDNPVSLAAYGPLLFILEMGAGRVRALNVQRP